MKGKLTIFVVCATVLQNSVALLPPGASGIQDRAILDLSLLRAHRAVADFQCEKVAQSIATAEQQGFLADACLQNKYGAEENSYITNTCKDEVLVPLMGAFDAVLASILIVDPEASSAVATAQAIGSATETKLAEGICSAIRLGLGKNSSEAIAGIKNIGDKQASGAAIFNAVIFAAIRNGRDAHPKIESAIKIAESKATSQLVTAIYSIFTGIQTLVSNGTRAGSKDIFAMIKIAQNRTSTGIKADLHSKFDLLRTLFTVSSIVEYGMVADSPEIEAVMALQYYGCNTSVSCLTSSGKDQSKVGTGHNNKILTGDCEVQDARETALFQAAKGVAAIFDTIGGLLTEVPSGNQNVSEIDSHKFETARKNTAASNMVVLDALANATLIVSPGANSAAKANRNASESAVNKIIDVIYDAMKFFKAENSSKVLAEIQVMEDSAIRGYSSIIEDVYNRILSDRKIGAKLRTTIEYAKKESISQIKKSYHGIFIGIRIRIANSSRSQAESEASIVSIKVARTEAYSAMEASIQNMFDAIQNLSKASVGNQTETVANMSAIRLHREIALHEALNAIAIVFNSIMADYAKVPRRNENPREDDSGDIESNKAETSAAYRAAVEAVFCAIPSNHSVAFLTVRNAVLVAVQKALNNEYKGISAALDNPSNNSRIQAIEVVATSEFSKVVSNIYIALRKAQECDAETEASLDRAQEETNFNIVKSCQYIFNAIRILAAAISSRNQIDNGDSSSSIEAAYYETQRVVHDMLQIIFNAIELVLSTCGENQAEISGESCADTVS